MGTLIPHKSFALVLGGGGARGFAHVGVLSALSHLGYRPAVIVGVSMGSITGATFALNNNWYHELVNMDIKGIPETPDFSIPGLNAKIRNLMIAQRALKDMYFGWGVGQNTVEWGKSLLRSLTQGKSLQQGDPALYVCATDILTGQRVVLNTGDAADAVYASAAIAGILPPLDKDPYLLVDGAYSDIAPVDVARQTGIECVIAVDPSNTNPTKIPSNGLQAMLRGIDICQYEHANLRYRLADLVIQPRFSRSIGTLDFEYKRDSIAAGAIAIRRAIPKLRHILNLTSKNKLR